MSDTQTVETAEQESDVETNTDVDVGATETSVPEKGKSEPATIASGVEEQPEKEEPVKSYWPEDWRQRAAEHVGGSDKKAVARELKRLERIADPAAVFGMYRDLEARFSEGGLVKVPKEGASEEEVKRYRDAMGIPEKADAYIENMKVPEGMVLGDNDKAIAKDFAEYLHQSNAPQGVFDRAMEWYSKQQEAAAEAQDEFDETYRETSLKELKEEFGGMAKLKGAVNAIGTLRNYGDGDTMDMIMSARLPDGSIAGNNPAVLRMLHALAREVNPEATLFETGQGDGKNVKEELESIKKIMREDRRAYDKDTAMQARYRELLEADQKIRAKAA